MNDEKRYLIKQWIEKAENDLIAARILIESNPLILDIGCFHCQQSVEKYLKTFLIYNEVEFDYTHNLFYLLKACGKIDNIFERLDIKNLNVFAVHARFPDDSISPELTEAKYYYQIAENIKKIVLERLQY